MPSSPVREAEKTFPRVEVVVRHRQQVVELAESWKTPKLWWPNDQPVLQVLTTIELDGRPST